jgi:hypothetical protein
MDEVDKLAARLALRPEQREMLREIFRDGSEEIERALREHAERAVGPEGARASGAGDFQAITEGAARRIESRVRDMLDPAQRPLFDAIVEEDRRAREGAEGAPAR